MMATTIRLDAREDFCTIYLINRGLRVEGQMLTVEFASTGEFNGFTCILNKRLKNRCKFSIFRSNTDIAAM